MQTSTAAGTAAATPGATLGIALSFVAGYVDTLGFVALFGLFTAHVTGNFVLIGSELAAPTHGVVIKFLAFPSFILGVVLARLLVLHADRGQRNAAPRLLAAQAVLLAGFMGAGLWGGPVADARSASAMAAGMLGAAAMGIQNGAGRMIWNALTPTTVMTGNVTALVIDTVDLWRTGSSPELVSRIHKFLWPVIAFGGGAMLGALAFQRVSFAALLLPMAIVAYLIAVSVRATS